MLCARFARYPFGRAENFSGKKGSMSGKRKAPSKKESELIKQSARADSQARQARIKELLDLIASGKLVPNVEESCDTAKDLKKEVEELFAELTSEETFDRPVRDENPKSRITNEPVRSLGEIVVLQKSEIEYLRQERRELERIRHYYPEHLQYLSSASLAAEFQPELKGRAYKGPGGVGLIEWEFGGGAEAARRKSSLGWSGLPYEPTCLDEILRGGFGERRTLPGTVNPLTGEAVVIDTLVDMRRLEDLFGLERHRFPKKLQLHRRRVGKEFVYEWRGVVEIMRALLKDKRSRRRRRGKGKKPGPPLRIWPKPALRARVFGRLEERINVVCEDAKIADAFLALIKEFRS
jgi:hypothetical protein